MDPRFHGFSGPMSGGIQFGNQSGNGFPGGKQINGSGFEIVYPDQNQVNGVGRIENKFLHKNFGGIKFLSDDPSPISTVPSSTISGEDELNEDCDLSDAILGYISQVLMEEDMEDQTCMLQESLSLQAAEKSFYEILGQKYPPSPQQDLTLVDHYRETSFDYFSQNHNPCTSYSSHVSGYALDPGGINSPVSYNASQVRSLVSYSGSQSPIQSSNSSNNGVSVLADSPISPDEVANIYNESELLWQFKKGVEEASKFLPSGNKLLLNLLPQDLVGGTRSAAENDERKRREFLSSLKWRKNPYQEDDVDKAEERSSKQVAIFPDSTLRSDEFDLILLNSMGEGEAALHVYREKLMTEARTKNGEQKLTSKGKGRGKKQGRKKEVIDLRILLITCAQAVAADDQRNAKELLKQIRQHSSPYGDGSQRLAHCFADGLEARMAGTGSQIHKALVSKKMSAADYIKGYHLFLASCPFRKISIFASNRTIRDLADEENATRIHIIDFGILYGFQWPTFFQRIAPREGGPQRVRITGIEFPQPGFRPAQRIEETGHRLAEYAKTFNVSFEYTAIAKRWETITVEDLKLDKDEFVAVNCLYRSKNLLDETVVADSSRNIVLNLIRKINPNVFIHGVINGSYNAPFFVTRFREALFHFSALFDMLDTNVSRERSERMLIEREIFGKEALNVIACEGWERVERPETYKQWHVRNLRAGFVQIPIGRHIVERAMEKVSMYHKDFVFDEDGQWLLQGWKGRTIYAISCWKPV